MITKNSFRQIILFIGAVLFIMNAQAQVGIGTATPDASAQLEITATNKGLLIPRVVLGGTNDISTITSPKTSLLVYNTSTSGSGTTAVSPGFYYWDGTQWERLDLKGTSWSLTGNSGITSNNFIGTLDTQPIYFRVNNDWAGFIGDMSKSQTFFGLHAGIYSTAAYTSAFGYGALGNYGVPNTGIYNTALGAEALNINTSGQFNTGVGARPLYKNNNGSNNTAVGSCSIYSNTSGNYNSALGDSAMFSGTVTNNNVAIGHKALFNNNGDENTAVGSMAMSKNIAGKDNTALGFGAGPLTGFLNNTTAIGANAVTTSDNSVIIGNTSVTYIGGAVNWTSPSDARFKTDIKPEEHGLDFILKLRPVTYHFNMKRMNQFLYGNKADSLYTNASFKESAAAKERITYTGFIAQEVEKAANEAGYDFSGLQKPANEKDHYRLDYSSFVVPLVKAVQEQQETIKTLQSENKQLQQKQQSLEERLQRLETLLKENKG